MRNPANAGRFYPIKKYDLLLQLDTFMKNSKLEDQKIIGAVVPHDCYISSGKLAAEVYARLPKRETYIIMGPNHYGSGNPIAMSRDSWVTPLGVIEVDQELAESLNGSIVDHDESAHLHEYDIEVQLPFLQYRFSAFKILPIILGLQDEETSVTLGDAIGEAASELERNCALIATSDFNHYEPQKLTKKIDAKIIEPILNMDISEFYARIYRLNATACGYGPIAAVIKASKILGANNGRLIRYTTTGEISRDYDQVVGYSAIVFTKD